MHVYLAAIMLAIAFVRPVSAEPGQPATIQLTLKEAIKMALENNHRIRAAAHTARSSRYSADIAASGYYPNLYFEEAVNASNSPTQTFMMKLDQGRFTQNDFIINNLNNPSDWYNFKTALTVRQPLYDPSIFPARDIAARDADKARQGHEATQQDMAFQVFVYYLENLRAVAHLKAVEQARQDAEESLRLARVRKAEGLGLLSDELRAQTHLASIEQQLITARNNITLSRMKMAMVVAAKDDVMVDVSEPISQVEVVCSEELVKTALLQRKDLQQYRIEIEKGDALTRQARNAYLPSLDMFASYQMNSKQTPFGSDNDSWLAGISLKWQVFDGFRRGNESNRAIANRSAASEELSGKIREVRFQVQESCLRREEAQKHLDVAARSLQGAQESSRLISRRFENSLATMAELLDAQTALNQARAALVDAEAGLNLSGGRVYYSSGIFIKEIMK